MGTAAGYYPDPDPAALPGRRRYWDGTRWTAQTQDVAPPPAPSASSWRTPLVPRPYRWVLSFVGAIVGGAIWWYSWGPGHTGPNVTVIYETAGAGTVIYEDPNDNTIQRLDTTGNWSRSYSGTVRRAGALLQVIVTGNPGTPETVSCRILVNGTTVDTHSSSGTVPEAACKWVIAGLRDHAVIRG